AAAQSRAVEGLRCAWCVLGLVHRTRSPRSPCQYATASRLVRAAKIVVACARGLPTCRSAGCTQGDRCAASYGQGAFEAMTRCSKSRSRVPRLYFRKLRKLVPGRRAMLRTDVGRDQIDRRRQQRRVIGKPQYGQHVGNGINRQYKISDRAYQRYLDRHRRVAIEGTIVGGEQIFSEGN